MQQKIVGKMNSETLVYKIISNQDFRFPSQLRLIRAADYKRVFVNPVRTTDKFFTVLAVNNHLQHPRLGLAIAKKQIARAVARNRIKRTIRESFRLRRHQLNSLDIVVLARRDAGKAAQELLRSSLERHWQKLADRCGIYS